MKQDWPHARITEISKWIHTGSINPTYEYA